MCELLIHSLTHCSPTAGGLHSVFCFKISSLILQILVGSCRWWETGYVGILGYRDMTLVLVWWLVAVARLHTACLGCSKLRPGMLCVCVFFWGVGGGGEGGVRRHIG